MDLRTGHAFWPLRSGLLATYPRLHDDEAADVVIIGAGVTGALAAYELTAAGADVVVLDQRDVAMGSSAATTGLLMYATDTSLEELERLVGTDGASRAYRLGLEAIDRIESICAALPIPCGFARRPSLYLASSDDDARALERECVRRVAGGFDVALLTGDELKSRYGVSRPAALYARGDGEIDCYRFVHGLLAAARAGGARIYDRTRATKSRPVRDGIVVETKGGPSVRATRVLSAGGYEVVTELSRETGTLHSTWVFISEPVDESALWRERCLIWETSRPYLYLRTTDDHRVIVGGEDEPFSRRHERRRLLRVKTRRLQEKMRELMPTLDLDVAYCWAGVFGTTRDGLPYIGEVPEHPRTSFALGYGGNGITFSAIAARLAADAWRGRPNPDARIFAFDRAKPLARHGVLALMRSVLSSPFGSRHP